MMKRRNDFTVMARLIGLVKPLAGYMFLAIIMGLIGHLCASFITIFGGFAILKVLNYPVPISLLAIFISVGIFALIRGFLRYGEQSCNHFIAFKLLALIRDKVFAALRKLCPAKLEGKDKGDLIAIITSDIELLEVFYAHTISPIAIAGLFCAIMCIFIAGYHWGLGLIALVAYVVVGVVIPLITSKLSGETGNEFRDRSGELSSFVLDSLRGLSEIIQYGQGVKRLRAMNEQSDELSNVERSMKKVAGRNMAVTNSIILIFDLVMLFTAAMLRRNNMLEFDGVLISTLALMSSFGPVVALANLGSTLQNTFAAGNRVLNILEEEPVVADITGREQIVFEGAKARNVNFAYEETPILQDFSIEIPKNKVIGITGKSGSGKSTFLKLLMRFWKVDSGEIRISENNMEDINTSNLRELESFVTQETHLFSDTIMNNVRIARLDATDDEVMEACKKASIHDVIMSFPNGYETQAGELGDSLSGGEKQRIGLARAFLHDGDLILLDEPTSNLDSLNEAVILKSLKEGTEGKTVILVSHRQSTMGIADVSYSVEYGRMS